jgi:hypothetical protein
MPGFDPNTVARRAADDRHPQPVTVAVVTRSVAKTLRLAARFGESLR